MLTYREFKEFRRPRNEWKNQRVINRRVDWITRTIYCYYLEYPLLKLALWLKLTANQVSIYGIIFGIIGAFLLFFDIYILKLIGCLLLQVTILSDWIDGDIARLNKSLSLKGSFLDKIMFESVIPIIFLSIGFSSYFTQGHIFYFSCGVFAAIGYIASKHFFNLKINTVLTAGKKEVKFRLNNSKELDPNLKNKFANKTSKIGKYVRKIDFIWSSNYIIIFLTFLVIFKKDYLLLAFYGFTYPIITIRNYFKQINTGFDQIYDWITEGNTFD